MLAIAFVLVTSMSDSLPAMQEIDVDTIEFSADIDALDWLGSSPYSLRVGVTQRDIELHTFSYRVDASYDSTIIGARIESPTTSTTPSGYWMQSPLGGVQFTLGDFGLYAGSGLLLGTSKMGMRSTQSVHVPQRTVPLVRPWKARYLDPAIRGAAVSTTLDSGALDIALAGGMSLRDSTPTYVAMASHHEKDYTLGCNILLQPEHSHLGASAWVALASGPHNVIGEITTGSSSDVSLQIAYKLTGSAMRLAASFWACGRDAVMPLGALLAVSSQPRNTWGIALSTGLTQRSFVGWNVWLLLRGSSTRTYDTPFPTLEYALRAEVRQTVTSQLHVTWRMFATRDDDGQTINELRVQRQIYRFGLQSTIERIVRPTLLWRARADIRWLVTTGPAAASATTRVEVVWQTQPTLWLRLRALQFASSSYMIASRTVDYVSQDLQRMIFGNGYGIRYSFSALWVPHTSVECSVLTSLTTTPTTQNPTVEMWLAVTARISQARDTHLPREESAEQ